MRIKIDKKNEAKILNLYLKKELNVSTISKMLKCNTGTIYKYLHKNGIQLRTERAMIDTVKHHIFDRINSHEKAYWLGFLWADGHIHICLVVAENSMPLG